MSKFKVGDRVVHETGGPGEVVEFWNPGTSEHGYMVKLDSGRQGGGANGEWFVFESYLTLEGAPKEEEPQFKVNERVQLRGRLGTVVQVCDGFTEVNFDTRGLVTLSPTNSRGLNRVTDVEDCVLKKTGFKPKFKIGDRVVHRSKGPGEVVKVSINLGYVDYSLRLDSGVQGGGIDGEWVTLEDMLVFEEDYSEPKPKFKVGDRVVHQTEGPGEVIKVFFSESYIEYDVKLDSGEPGGGPNGSWVTFESRLILEEEDSGGKLMSKFKVGDRVVHKNEGPGKIVKVYDVRHPDEYDYAIKLDSGEQGGGPNGEWLAFESYLTLQEDGSDGLDVNSKDSEVYKCELCRFSLMGCSECTKESVKARLVFGRDDRSNIMIRMSDIWVPEHTTTAIFKLQDGTYLEMPEPQGEGWRKGIIKTSEFDFVVEVDMDEGTIDLNNPFEGEDLVWVTHQEGLVWLHDMRHILLDQKAQLINISAWRYKPQEVVEEPYNYHCASRNELKGRWPTSRTP